MQSTNEPAVGTLEREALISRVMYSGGVERAKHPCQNCGETHSADYEAVRAKNRARARREG